MRGRRRTVGWLRRFILRVSASLLPTVAVAVETDGILSSEPLASPQPRDLSQPLYVELDPVNTGLASFTNDYESPHIWGKHWRTYLFGAIGTGIAVGDVDGDGLPDIFAVSKNERSRLYQNVGGFKFEEITEASGIDDGEAAGIDKVETPGGGAAFADVNNDGHLDLYLCYLGARNQLWINDGAGHFEESAAQWGVDVSTASVMGSFADYDGDGLLDLYLATNLLQTGDEYPGPKPDFLFRNVGDRFVNTTQAAGISGEGHAHAAIWWDYDADGRMDIYVANDFAEVDRLYHNRGDGTFENAIADATPRAPYYAMGADFGDINGDGLADFWVADMAPSSRSRYKSTLESHRHVYEGSPGTLPHQYMQNVLLLNLNGKRFADVAALAGLHRTDWTWAARLADLDSDGRLDAFATNGMLRNFNDGDLGIRLQGRNTLLRYAQIFRPTPVLEEANVAYRNLGGLRFEETGHRWGLSKVGVSFGAALADFDGDGLLDLALSNFREPPSVHQNLGTEANRVIIELRGVESNHFGVGARVELTANQSKQVKTLMPQRGYMSSDEPVLHFGLGDAEQIESLVIHWPNGRIQTLGQLAVNRRYVVKEGGSALLSRAESSPRFERIAARFPPEASREDAGAEEFSQQPLLPFARSRLISAAVADDLNDDRRADLVLGGPSGQGIAVLLGGEDFAFEHVWSLDLEEDFPSAEAGLVLRDFNGDDALDLVAASGGTALARGDPAHEDRLYLGDGDGGFSREFSSAISEHREAAGAVAVADFDADGLPDLFVGGGTAPGRYPENAKSILWKGNAEGGFERFEEDELSGVGRVAAAAWADFENDGYPELVIMREWAAPQLWRNRNGSLTLEVDAFGGAEYSGLWASLAMGDFNGDGRLDLVAGNLGLNAGGLWNPEKGPRRLWWRASEAGIQLIETHVEEGREWPMAWRDRLIEATPGFSVAANSYSEFAERPIGELFGDLEQQGFHRLEIAEPRSGIFWQRNDGSFEFEALPAFMQTGRLVDLLAADIDADGISDIVASIEPPSAAPWSDRAEQGHVALVSGRTDRQLVAELPWRSGLDVGANSPRELLWADFDGDGFEELVIVLAEGDPLVFSPRR